MKSASQNVMTSSQISNVSNLPIRVKRSTCEKLAGLLERVNKKDFGKRVRSDEIVCFALSLLTDAHIKQIQDGSLSNHDRLEVLYKEHVAKKGAISKDAFLGLLLNKKVNFSGNAST